MLSSTSREEVLRKLSAKVGYPVREEELTADTRKAITALADFQRHLFVIKEVLNGERGRVEGSALLSLKARVRKDKEIEAHSAEISEWQKELDSKMDEISLQIVGEVKAGEAGTPPPSRESGIEAVQLKCPTCGASLPMPTGRYVRCQYCNSTVSVQDVGPQMREMIRSI